jgi:hydroxylamine reductase
MSIPEEKIYPRTGDTQTIYLNSVITNPDITIGDYTMYKDDSLSADALVALTLEEGKYGVTAIALLDKANTETYGDPEIT